MRIFKLVIPIFFFILFIASLLNVDCYKYDNQMISVEVKGNAVNNGVYTLDKDSTFSNLLELIEVNDNTDISKYSLTEPLYNKQIIYINQLSNSLISINNSTIEELITLPGIGTKTAELIIEYREKNNGFKYLEELKNVKGIGDKKFEKIKDQISL